ncbi:purine-cytosine permease [Cyathus striatus]|nr:purine-cytosine permease [Cyathus striatus]
MADVDTKEDASSVLDFGSPSPIQEKPSAFQKVSNVLLRWGVETNGITPIPEEERTDKRLYQMFFVWFSANFNILAFGTGSAGPAFFSLGLRDSLIIIVLVDLITCAVPAYFAVFGPKLGTRGMVQSRFTWGYYGSIIPSILNVFSMQGFLILNCIIGGQTLAAVSDKLNATLGIVIIGVVSLLVTFCGYKVVHRYESLAWIPNAVAFIAMLGAGGKHLNPSTFPEYPKATAFNIFSFSCFLASSVISWCTMTPDYGVYHNAKASTMRIFIYTYLGFLAASLVGHMLGAAFAAASPGVPSWEAGFDNGNDVGGLIGAILAPANGFGKFLIVMISLSVPSACAPTMYTFGMSFMTISPFFAKIPRYVFTLISEAILIPVAIIGATRFYGTLVNVLSIIGYWSTSFAATILIEHFVFRRGNFTNYNIAAYNKPYALPIGAAAILAFAGSFALIVPSMSQVWYIGPIANAGTGDIGIITGGVSAGLLYLGLRAVEKHVFPNRIA